MTDLATQCPVLAEMFRTHQAHTLAGQTVDMNSNLPWDHAEALFQMVRQCRAQSALEVGMAFGSSSLSILAGLASLEGPGRLTSVDPKQTDKWQGCGVASVARAGLASRHELVEDFDYAALPRLLAEGRRLDFAYIDGWHTFDYTLLDFWYIDRMLQVGGVVGFNDCGMPAVHKVIRFLLTHRKYQELDSGLAWQPLNHGPLARLRRKLSGEPGETYYRCWQDRYFRKEEDFEPVWDFYAEF